jgi:Mg2+ and Co2+ transporter CorA
MELCWITETDVRPLSDDAAREAATRDDGVLWAHCDHTDAAGMSLLAELVPARATDLQACHVRSPVPLLRAYNDHFFSAMNGLARGSDRRLHFVPVKIFTCPPIVFTVLGPRHDALADTTAERDIQAVQDRLRTSQLRPRSAYELSAAIRLQTLTSQEELVAEAASRITELELNVIRLDPVRAEALLGNLFAVRHDLQTIGTNAAQTHELYSHLSDQVEADVGILPIDPKVLRELRQSYGHLKNTTDLEREYLQEVLDLFQTRVSTELNRFVRKITAFGTIAVTWTVITGVYGMNFIRMPELEWHFGYPAVLGLMALIGVLLVVFFRRRGWV